MGTKNKRINYYNVMASASQLSLPLPTAYGHASSDIFVLDSLSCFYSATGGASTAAYGGLMKSWIGVNGSAYTSAAFSQMGTISYFPTAAANGVNFGGFIWESVDGIPLWKAVAATPGDTGVVGTAYTLAHSFTGAFATGGAAVEVYMNFHFENPSERR